MDNSINKYNIGMIGLGTMGRNLALNLADHGFSVSGYDKNDRMLAVFQEKEQAEQQIGAFSELSNFMDSLELPRKIILLVPAGIIVDQVIEELKPHLNAGDILIDSGNSYFADTQRRANELQSSGFHFFGMGISGGEEGARFGPSLMPGGDKVAYEHVRPMLEAVSAKVNGQPCVNYIGAGSAGHFVKMTHNGIEYAIMQLLSEIYGIFKHGLKYNNEQIHQNFQQWNTQNLKSFLVEITADIFTYKDPETGLDLIDLIKDQAKSKGTGKWTSQIAMDLEVPVPTIDVAVSSRNLSKLKNLRSNLSELYKVDAEASEKLNLTAADVESAYFVAMAASYAQGLHLLTEASAHYKYGLNVADIAKIWRGGCIIRAEFLEIIHQAYAKNPHLPHLFADKQLAEQLIKHRTGLANVVAQAAKSGLIMPALASSLTYLDSLLTENLPSNLTQAQRDYFGAHTFERVDKDGVFHAQWLNKNA